MAGLYFESGIDKGFEDDLKKLNQQINNFASNTSKKSDEIDDSFKSIDHTLKNLSTVSIANLTRAADQLNAEINQLERNTVEYKKKAGDLSKVENELSKVRMQMQGAAVQAQTFGQKIKGLAGNIIPFAGISGAIAAIGAVFANAYTKIKEFSSGISELKAITGLAGQDIDFLKEKAKLMAKEYGTAASEIVTAMKLVGSAKPELLSNAEGLSAMTEQVMILSKASGLDLTTATNALAGSLNQFNAPASKAGEYIDILASAAQKGTREIPFLSDFILRTGKIASDSGVSFKELAARAELLGPSFESPELAATGFVAVLRNLQKAGIGYETGSFNLSEALETVKTKLSGMGSELEKTKYQQDLFGDALTAGKVLLETNGEKTQEFVNALGQTGSALKQATEQMNNMQGDLNKASGAWDSFILGIEDGDGVLSKVIRGGIQGFTWLIDTSSKMAKSTEFATSKLGKLWDSNSNALNNLKNWASDTLDYFIKMNPVFAKAASWLKELFTAKPQAKEFKEVVIDKEAIKKRVIAEFEERKKAKAEAEKKDNIVSDEQKKQWIDAYKEQLNLLQNHLSEQKQNYINYNRDIEGLSSERKDIISKEYAGLIDTGKTYLEFLTTLLAKEKDARKQAVIKKEITTVQLEQTINEQQGAQKSADEKKAELEKLTELYKTYSQKRADLEKKYNNEIELLRTKGYKKEAKEAYKASQVALKQLQESFVNSNELFSNWVNTELPRIAAKGKEEITEAMSSISLTLKTPGLDPDTVLIYKAQIEELRKKLEGVSTESEVDAGDGKAQQMLSLLPDSSNIKDSVKEMVSGINTVFSSLTDKSASTAQKAGGIIALVLKIGDMIHQKVVRNYDKAAESVDKLNKGIAQSIESASKYNEIKINELKLQNEASAFYGPSWTTQFKTAYAEMNLANQQMSDSFSALLDNIVFTTEGAGEGLLGLSETTEQFSFTLDQILNDSNNLKNENAEKLATFFDPIDLFGSVASNQAYSEAWDSAKNVVNSALQAMGKTAGEVANFSKKEWEDFFKILGDSGTLSAGTQSLLSTWQESVEQYQTALETMRDIISDVSGSIYEDLQSALVDSVKNGSDALDTFGDKLNDILFKLGETQMMEIFFNNLFDQLQTEMQDSMTTGDQSWQDDLLRFYGKLPDAISNAELFLEDYNRQLNELGFAGYNDIETQGTGRSVTGQIAETITEETGTVLAGHMGAIMLSNEKISNYAFDALDYAMQNLVYMKAIKTNTDFLPEIAENTRKTYQKLESI